MSHSLLPTNKSIFGWVKSLKRGSLMSSDSVNDLSDLDLAPSVSKSPSKSLAPNLLPPGQPIPFPTQAQLILHSQQSPHLDFLRPLLHHKLRSTNNVNRTRSDSLNQLEKSSSIRQHRDSFLQHNPLVDENSKYFGVSLDEAISQAAAKISILSDETSSDDVLQYGKIPIVVAKCGVYLKRNGLKVEGIFRVGGSSKRLKDLQVIFNSPPDFGKKLNWDGYTVHDAASILRRYLNALPEPLILLDLYEDFRDPLRHRPRIINYMKYKAENPNKLLKPVDGELVAALEVPGLRDLQPLTEANIGRLNTSHLESTDTVPTQEEPDKRARKTKNYKKLTRDVHEAIEEYRLMVDNLPQLSKQLLFYILDLLAMVQNNSADNLMSLRNLAAIFQPSILSHPNHDMDPVEYALSQLVVEFLVQYAYKLLPQQQQQQPVPECAPKPPAGDFSTTTSTSTTPLEHSESESALLPKPLVQTRKHSKSLSVSSTNDELIGYQSNANKSVPVVDLDHGYELTDDENDTSDVDELQFPETSGAEDPFPDASRAADPVREVSGGAPKVAILVSAPSNPSVALASKEEA